MKKLSTDEVRMWQERIKLSAAWREPFEKKWNRYIGYLQGKYITTSSGMDEIAVNLVHPMVRVIIPAVYSKNPDVVVYPRKSDPQTVEAANVMQVFLRYLFKEIGLKREIKLCILDALLTGHAWVKTGFQTDYDEDSAEEIKETSSKIQTMIDMFLRSLGLKKPSDKELNEEYEEAFALNPNEKVIEERPWALRTSIFDIFVPAYSSRVEELPWIVHRTLYPMVDLKAHPTLWLPKTIEPSCDIRELLRKKGQEVSFSTLNDNISTDDDLLYKVIDEIYDLRTGRILHISDNDDYCYGVKRNEYDFLDARHPFVRLAFNEVTDQFYPMSDVEPWEPQIDELNKTRTQMLNHRKRYNRRYVYKENAFTAENLELLKSGEDGIAVPTSEDSAREAFVPVEDAALPPDVYAVEQRIKQDITEISGITGYQKGNTQAGAKTATEAAIVESQSRSRSEERVDVVNEFANAIAKNLAEISQKFMSKEVVFPIVGELALSWVQIDDSEAIKGDFMYETIFGSSLPVDPNVDRQQFMEFYNMAANDPMFDPVKLRLELVRKSRLPAPETFLNMKVAKMIKDKRIQDALSAKPPTDEETTETPTPDSTTSSPEDMKRGIDSQVAVPTPGGIGGGALETL